MLDHHKTAAEALEGSAPLPANIDVHLDMERSGATISLDYFQPQVVTETPGTVSIDNMSLCLQLQSKDTSIASALRPQCVFETTQYYASSLICCTPALSTSCGYLS